MLYYDHIEQEELTAYLQSLQAEQEAERKAQEGAEAAEEAARLEDAANPSFYQKLSKGYDVNILIVGDSIGAGTGASDEEHRWVNLVFTYITETYGSAVTLTNISMGGNTSYAGYSRVMMLDDDVDYDLAVICYGQNDSTENFSLYYESIITAITGKYENCSIISILESSQKDYTEKITTIQSICNYYEVPVVDTIETFQKNYDNLSDDGIHPNDDGHAIYAECVEETLDELVGTGEGFPNYDGELFEAPTVTFDYDFSQRHILIVSDDCTVEEEIKIVLSSKELADEFQGLTFSWE